MPSAAALWEHRRTSAVVKESRFFYATQARRRVKAFASRFRVDNASTHLYRAPTYPHVTVRLNLHPPPRFTLKIENRDSSTLRPNGRFAQTKNPHRQRRTMGVQLHTLLDTSLLTNDGVICRGLSRASKRHNAEKFQCCAF